MPVLKNARRERFVQGVAKGMSATEAYEKAGYKPSGPNAGRMTKNDEIVKRRAELQGSTARQITDVRDAARQHTLAAVETLASVMADLEAPHSARVAAANGLLDRGHGKAVQHIEAEISVYDSLDLPQKQALLAVIDEVIDGLDEGNEEDPERPGLTHH